MFMEGVVIIVYLLVLAFFIICGWKIYEKAGEPGWASIVPIYNLIIFFKIIGKPWWWLFLFCIPLVNIIFIFWSLSLFAKSFGKGTGFMVGLIFLSFIFIPLLAFGDAQYQGPAGLSQS
jgi:hypothetical protein